MASKKKKPSVEADDEAEEMGDIAIWDVDETLEAYGRDRALKAIVEGQYTGIIRFMSDNGLFEKKRRAVDAAGKLLIRQVFDRDLTKEGQKFVRLTIKPWFRSKTSAKDPSNTAILEKHLAKLRE
jgi:hypothetical protein